MIGGLMVEVESRIVGGLLGVAAGDALGATLEFMSPSEIRRRIGVHREITGVAPSTGDPGGHRRHRSDLGGSVRLP